MHLTIKEITALNVDAEIRERLNFIQKYISEGNRVGYYEGRQIVPIKLTELVSFDNAIVIGTNWDDYKEITNKMLVATNIKGGTVAVLKPSDKLERYLQNIRRA